MRASERLGLRTRWLAIGALVLMLVGERALSEWRRDHALMINATDSLPHWAFFVSRGGSPARDDFVFFAPPHSALVTAHFGAKPRPFGKRVLGLPGDVVSHDGMVVRVNGHAVARRKPLTRSGEALAAGPTGAVPANCFYVGTPHPDGFDSRYAAIGFVCRRQILGTGSPLL